MCLTVTPYNFYSMDYLRVKANRSKPLRNAAMPFLYIEHLLAPILMLRFALFKFGFAMPPCCDTYLPARPALR